MIVNRLKNILKANISDQWEKLSENEFDVWKTYFDEDKKGKEAYKQEDFLEDEEEWERYSQQKHYEQPQHNAANQKEKDYYADLELKPGAEFAEIKKGYRRMVKLYHPDLFQHDPKKQAIAKEVTRKINEAYDYFEKKHGK